jgi:hypothetical protein
MQESEKEQIQKVYDFFKSYYQKYGKSPVIGEIIKQTGLTRKKISSILTLLVKYKYLKFKNKRYRTPEQIKGNKVIPKIDDIEETFIQEESNQIIQDIKEEKPIKKNKINNIFVLKIILGLIFVSFCFLGIQANYIAYLFNKLPQDAFISASGFFIFEIIAFDFFIFFRIRKNYGLSRIFFLIFIMLFLNNFLNIFTGQYVLYQNKVFSSENLEKENNENLNDLYSKQEELLNNQLNDKYEKRDIYKFRYDLNNKDKSSFYSYLSVINKEIPDIQNKIKVIQDKREHIFLKNQISKKEKIDVYGFISKNLWNLNSNIIKFIHLIFPSFLLSLISSISLALIMFLKNE